MGGATASRRATRRPDLAADPVGLLLLEEETANGEDASYWIACHNFYVITRYNRSRLYAAAVWELAQAHPRSRARRRCAEATRSARRRDARHASA